MTQITDEMLVAYVDGELSAEDSAEIETALQTDQKVREAVRIFRETADWSRRAFDDVLREPVPERLIQAATGQGIVDQRNAGRADEAPWIKSPGRQGRFAGAGLAMAASIALAIGIGGGYGLSGLVGPGESGPGGHPLVGSVDQAGALHAALETTASGTLTRIADTGDVMPLTTFVENDGRYCREFQATLAGVDRPEASFGIACRQPAGSWQVEAVVAAPTAAQDGTSQFVTASGAAKNPLQILVGAMTDVGPISSGDEATVLATGWK